MNFKIIKSSAVIVFSLILLALYSGCGKKEAVKETSTEEAVVVPDENELFAKAQGLQKDDKYDEAVRIYRQIVREYPDSKKAANSQFMIGYIYANHIDDLEQAQIELNRFLEKFSETADSGLVAGAQFELKYLGKDIDEIEILSELGIQDTTTVKADK